MLSENLIHTIILIHATFGGLALLTGLIAIIAKKGSPIHKKSGLFFFYSMLISAIIAMFVAVLPKHESPFLFSIGIFSSYLILTGFRAMRFKKAIPDLKMDKIISMVMLATGILMILLPLILTKSINIVLAVFGAIGAILSFRDLKLYQNHEKLKSGWLKLHLGKMIGGYIASVTAFVVVNNYFSGIYNWFIPSIIGVPYIFYWFNKLNKKN
jgi:uncharacterized membrane protein